MADNHGNLFQTTNAIDVSLPRAKDFLAHYPSVASVVDEWNQMAHAYNDVLGRFAGLAHTTAEEITGRANTGLPRLLIKLGDGDLDISDIAWRIENGQLEGSWEQYNDGKPAFSPVAWPDATTETMEQVQVRVAAFRDLPLVRERRRLREVNDRLRPILLSAFDDAELAVELNGRCPHCPR